MKIVIQWTDLPYGKLLVPALTESPRPAFRFSTIDKRKTTCMEREKPTPIDVRSDLSINCLYRYLIFFSEETILASIFCHEY